MGFSHKFFSLTRKKSFAKMSEKNNANVGYYLQFLKKTFVSRKVGMVWQKTIVFSKHEFSRYKMVKHKWYIDLLG